MLVRKAAKHRIIFAVLAVMGCGAGLWLLKTHPTPPVDAPEEYAPVESCRACHAGIYSTYQKVGMARSFYIPTPEIIGANLSDSRFYHKESDRHYEMLWRDDKLYQRRYQIGENGRIINELEQQVHFVIGSGNHARTFLHRSDNGEITELPLSWYALRKNWGMSPGYDRPKHFDFTRQIDHGCMFCHNSYPSLPPNAGRYGNIPLFPADLPQGIGCQRCHGPAGRHAALAAGGKASPEAVRSAVVNPKRLDPQLQMDLCMQCHLETTSASLPASTRRFGKSVYSYRPGQPLGDYMIYFDHAPGAGYEDKFEIVSAAYRLRKSACFLKSAGLTCTTCHNPHDVPRGKDAVAQHRERCMGCHELLPADTHPNPASSDCAGCHMPKRRAEDAVQVVMTDHFIRRKPLGHDSLAPLKEKAIPYRGDLVVYYPENLPATDREAYLGIALAAHGADRSRGISKLEHLEKSGSALDPKIKVELANAYMAEGRTKDAIAVYRAALDADPENDKARYNLGQALERSGELIEAQRQYEHLIAAKSGFAEAHLGLARLLSRTGRVDGARAAVQASLRLRPMYPEARNFLAVELLAKGDWAQARLELEEALRIEPDSAEALNNLAKVLTSEGKQREALELVNRAARLDPENAEIRLNFGRLLLMTGSVQRAIAELKKLVDGKPGFSEAHLTLGIAYGESGRMDSAIEQFREVLRLQPNHPDARRNLDVALHSRSNQ